MCLSEFVVDSRLPAWGVVVGCGLLAWCGWGVYGNK
jgi:hypothetical protein